MAGVDLVVDAMFGFSFKGPVRGVFKDLIATINAGSVPILSVDVPSGWDIDNGPIDGCIRTPEAVISLSVPKRCMAMFDGTHLLGGRFLPPQMVEEMKLTLPYRGAELVVRL